MCIQETQCQDPLQSAVQIMIQHASVVEKLLVVSLKPAGFSCLFPADSHRRGIDAVSFFYEFCQKQAVLAVAVLRTAAEQQGKSDPGFQ